MMKTEHQSGTKSGGLLDRALSIPSWMCFPVETERLLSAFRRLRSHDAREVPNRRKAIHAILTVGIPMATMTDMSRSI
jgi:hypothetical protein